MFLSGVREISTLQQELEVSPLVRASGFVLPLHSNLGGDECSRVFDPPLKGKRKVVLSTNIAETGEGSVHRIFVVTVTPKGATYVYR